MFPNLDRQVIVAALQQRYVFFDWHLSLVFFRMNSSTVEGVVETLLVS
jgi:hypothetical protein